jgi:hypothetical protein
LPRFLVDNLYCHRLSSQFLCYFQLLGVEPLHVMASNRIFDVKIIRLFGYAQATFHGFVVDLLATQQICLQHVAIMLYTCGQHIGLSIKLLCLS